MSHCILCLYICLVSFQIANFIQSFLLSRCFIFRLFWLAIISYSYKITVNELTSFWCCCTLDQTSFRFPFICQAPLLSLHPKAICLNFHIHFLIRLIYSKISFFNVCTLEFYLKIYSYYEMIKQTPR